MTGSGDAPDDFEVLPPAWWTDLQRDVGRLLRTPLDASGGRFRAETDAYSPELLRLVRDDGPGRIARLALYHEQVWRRLFTTLQTAFPRTASAVGYFPFNRIATAFLVAHPPRGFDLADASENFHASVTEALAAIAPPRAKSGAYDVVDVPIRALVAGETPSVLAASLLHVDAPWSLVVQSLHLDEAERRAFRAPLEKVWCPSSEERARIRSGQLRYAPSFSLLRLDYELSVGRAPEPLEGLAPARRGVPLHVAVVRGPRGVMTRAVDPVFARLLARARLVPLDRAVKQTEAALDTALRDRLWAGLDQYVDTALSSGWWVGQLPSRAAGG